MKIALLCLTRMWVMYRRVQRATTLATAACAFLGSMLITAPALAQNFEVLADFGAPEGMEPYGGLVEASDGYFYGTTASGGVGFGSIFRVDNTGTFETVFLFDGANGNRPEGVLEVGSDGLLYGTTRLGGSALKGTIFKFNPSNGAFTLLRSFGGADGAEPRAGLVEAADGNLYGTTSSGGLSGCGFTTCGTVFRITRAGAFSTLVKFNKANGGIPVGGLAAALDGRLFGTTSKGGGQDRGTLFALNLSGNLTTLHSFSFTDGFSPYGTLLRASDGKFYGTTYAGGAAYKGTLFNLTAAGVFKLVHSFSGPEGSFPVGALIEDADGALYGTATMGGAAEKGTVFKLAAGQVTRLISLTPSTGASPNTKLQQVSPGIFFGTMTTEGPPGSAGTLVKVTSAGDLTVLHAFKGSPVKPYGTLVEAANGRLLGTTRAGGGFGQGTIYSIALDGDLELLHAFAGSDGGEPIAPVMQASNGAVYGASTTGGANLLGTLVKRTSGGVTTLASMNVPSGFPSYGGLVETPSGDVYGTAYNGGANGLGTIFRITSGGAFSVVHHFGGGDGANPYAGLVRGPSGVLYGTTSGGGAAGLGAVFSFDPGSVTYRRLASFTVSTGTSPKGQLVYANDGYFYGTTMNSGATGFGTIFRFDSSTNSITVLYSFTKAGGGNPYAGLTEGAGSKFYGTTYVGGASNYGAVFQFDVATRQYAVLHSFNGDDGAYPHGGVVLASDGKLYGTTTTGGSTGNGLVFRVGPSAPDGNFGVEVTSPNGGELIAKDRSVALQWRPTGDASAIRSFDVQFSANGGSTFSPISGCTGLSANATSCTWASAGPATTAGRIRVIARGDDAKTANDQSDADFTIGVVTLTLPGDTANWGLGSKQQVKWKHNVGKATLMKVELSRDAGATWQVLTTAAKNTDGATGVYSWIVAGTATSQARVRVSVASVPALAGASAANFTIAAPFITVNKPVAGTIWHYGNSQTLSWKTNLGADKVTVLLSIDGGLTFPIVLAASTSATNSLTFKVPVLINPTTTARIRVKWLDGPVQGTSPGFAIKP